MTLPFRIWPSAALTLYRTFGGRGASLRAAHEARRFSGRFRAMPRHPSVDRREGTNSASIIFAVDSQRLADATNDIVAIDRAERVVAGYHQAYRWDWRTLPDRPDEWLVHPLTDGRVSADDPWWRTSHLDPSAGDIKELWEPARFGWAYDLVRGYLLTGDDRFAQMFYRRLANWSESSPSFYGPHWSCGQETTIRAVAILYAEANLASAPSTSPEHKALLRAILSASGERVRDAIGYAISQRNNHAISEAAGLVILGAHFRGEHPEADEWVRTGHRLLERLVLEQFATDGWYIQHSFNYLRLALHQLVLAERALRLLGRSLSSGAVARIRAASDLILATIEPATGIVPNHGANDGALVHPVTLAKYRDYRPVLTAVCAMWRIPLPADVVPDQEVLAWLGLDRPPVGEPLKDGVQTGPSGWAAIRSGSTSVFLRAGSYSSRPGHLDPLHLDVRIGGREVVVDPGTFAYNASPPWRNGLAGAAVHNGPVVDGREPGIRGPRFLWYLWPESRVVSTTAVESGYEVVAEVPDVNQRRVSVQDGVVVVEDRVFKADAREAIVCWLLHPDAQPEQVTVPGSELVEAKEGDVTGWFSPAYGVRIPSRSIRVRWERPSRTVVRTVITGSENG